MTNIDKTNKEKEYRFGCVLAEFWGLHDHQKNILRPRRSEDFFSTTDKFYHYTNLQGLYGIIQNKGFWLNHIRYMNDSEEYRHGRNLAIDILTRLSTKTSHSFFKDILSGAASMLQSDDIPDYYITCFSKNGDSLDQWRGYCRDGGVSIELFSGFKPPFTILPVSHLSDVIYSNTEKIKLILLAVKRLECEFHLDQDFYGNRFESYISDYSKDYIRLLSGKLSFMFTRFKHPAFSNEAEVRMIIGTDPAKHFKRTLFRATNNFLIPYYITSDMERKDQNGNAVEPEKLPISAVIVGPGKHQELTAISVKEYLNKSGYDGVDIQLSRIPFRAL